MTDSYPPGTPNWIDLGTTDIAGAASFYGRLFEWTHEDFGPDMGNYGMFFKDGKQVAGVNPTLDADRGAAWVTYFSVPDADDVAARVEANGGKVIFAPMDVADQGRMAVFTDPTGAFFSIWQAGMHTGAELMNAPGSLTWNELSTVDIEGAKAFYSTVLPLGTRSVSMGEGAPYTLFEAGGRTVAGALDASAGGGLSMWTVYFAVEDCDAMFAAALAFGATAIAAPEDSPAGRFGFLSDPQGGAFAILKNDPNFTI